MRGSAQARPGPDDFDQFSISPLFRRKSAEVAQQGHATASRTAFGGKTRAGEPRPAEDVVAFLDAFHGGACLHAREVLLSRAQIIVERRRPVRSASYTSSTNEADAADSSPGSNSVSATIHQGLRPASARGSSKLV